MLAVASYYVAFDVSCSAVRDGPSILFDHTRYDFGTVDSGTTVIRHQFRFRNVGSSRLDILDVKPTCNCVAVVPSERSAGPGDEGFVSVELTLPAISLGVEETKVKREVYVETNDAKNRLIPLSLIGTRRHNDFVYPSSIVFEPHLIGDPQEAFFYFIPSDIAPSTKEASCETTAAYLKAEVVCEIHTHRPLWMERLTETERFRNAFDPGSFPRVLQKVIVSVLPEAPAGRFGEYVIVHTDKDDRPALLVGVSGEVLEPLRIEPRRLFLGLHSTSERWSYAVEVISPTGEAFQIESVTSELACINASVSSVSPSHWRLGIGPVAGELVPGDFRGLVHVRSDVPRMENFTIGVYGRIRK